MKRQKYGLVDEGRNKREWTGQKDAGAVQEVKEEHSGGKLCKT